MPSVSSPKPEGVFLVAGTEQFNGQSMDNPDQQATTKVGNVRVWLEFIQPKTIATKEIMWIKQLTEEMYTEPTVKGVVTDLFKGDLSLWRIAGEADGIVILQFIDEPGGREMVIWGLIGESVATHFQHVQESFEIIARETGCRWISLFARNKRLAKIYSSRTGYETKAYFQVKELKNETL